MMFLEQYSWPGNVRELENLMEHLVITSPDPIIDVSALPAEYHQQRILYEGLATGGSLQQQLDAFEGQIIRQAYARCGSSVALAKELGISQPTAARKIAKYVRGKV